MPKYNNPRRTWKYSNDYKVNAIQLSYVVGVSIKSVAEKKIWKILGRKILGHQKYWDTQTLLIKPHFFTMVK
jgi:hypothetical protein